MNSRPLRICIDARVGGNPNHGAAIYALGLANALTSLPDGDEQYFVLCGPEDEQHVARYVRGPHERILWRGPASPLWKRLARRVPGLRTLRQAMRTAAPVEQGIVPAVSDGAIERAGIDVIHFPMQFAFRTSVASVYQPHDLQHIHYPEFFTEEERRRRDVLYRAYCDQASVVVMMTAAGREDVASNLDTPKEKVAVVHGASLLTMYPEPTPEEIREVRSALNLPEAFAFYPAQTWPHKNHIALLQALAILRTKGIIVPLVCSGEKNTLFSEIERAASELGLGTQVRFLGFVSTAQLKCLYRSARCLVFPTLFEGCGFPLVEAFQAGLPVACSNIPPLLEQAEGPGLLFDPRMPENMAQAIGSLWSDDRLRTELATAGRQRATMFTWERMARTMRAHYRRIAGRELGDSDAMLIAHPAASEVAE